MAGTTTGAGHKNTQHAQGPTGTVIKGEKATCAAEGIEAFCGHTPKPKKGGEGGGKVASKGAGGHVAHAKAPAPKPAPHPAATKPGEAAHPEDERRFAKEESEAPAPAPPGQPPRSGQPSSKPDTKLVLQVVPTPFEDEEKGGSGEVSGIHGLPKTKVTPHSTEVGIVKHVKGNTEGDKVTINARKHGSAAKCPEWTITDHGIGQSATIRRDCDSGPSPRPTPGSPLIYTFLPPDPKEFAQYTNMIQNPFFKMGWMDVVKPRHYTVVCTSPLPDHLAPASHHQKTPANHVKPVPAAHHPQAPTAHKASPPTANQHHTLEVYVYPSDKWTVKLTTEESAHKPPWEKILEAAKTRIEAAVDHLTALASNVNPEIPNVKIKLMDGELSLSNFWEEEKGSNLVHWTAELEGTITFIDLTVRFILNPSKFLTVAKNLSRVVKVAEKAVETFADFMKREAGISGQASLYIQGQVKVLVKGKGSWEKEKETLTANLKGLSTELTAGVGIGGEIEIDRMTDGQTKILAKLSGDGKTEVTLATSLRLGPSATLLLDNSYTWDPFKVTLTVQVNPKDDKADKGAPPGASTQAVPGAGEWSGSWSGNLFSEIKGTFPSLNLTTRTWEGAPDPKQEPKPLLSKSIKLPPLKPSSTPAVKPVSTQQIKDGLKK